MNVTLTLCRLGIHHWYSEVIGRLDPADPERTVLGTQQRCARCGRLR